MKLMKKKKGFTLIELMAVIAIIAILAAVLVPTVSGYINRSKKTAVITQVRTAVSAIESTNATITDPTKFISKASTATLSSLITAKAIDTDLLTNENINRLGSMTVQQAMSINADQDAISKITVSNAGVFTTYSGTLITDPVSGS